MSGYAFISYSRSDRAYVEALGAYLRSRGIGVWHDYDLASGDRFSSVIQERIDNCSAFVVVLTHAAVTSEWVDREISYAMRRNKPVLPLLLEPSPDHILLVTLHHEDVTGGRMPGETYLDNLRRLGATAPAEPEPAVQPKAVPRVVPAAPPAEPEVQPRAVPPKVPDPEPAIQPRAVPPKVPPAPPRPRGILSGRRTRWLAAGIVGAIALAAAVITPLALANDEPDDQSTLRPAEERTEPVSSIEVPKDPAAIAISPDGQSLAALYPTAGDSQSTVTLRLWSLSDPASPTLLSTTDLGARGNMIGAAVQDHALAFLADSRHILVSAQPPVWDISDPTHPVATAASFSADGSPQDFISMALSADGNTVTGASFQSLWWWDVSRPTEPRLLSGGDAAIGKVVVRDTALRTDGSLLVAGCASRTATAGDCGANGLALWTVAGSSGTLKFQTEGRLNLNDVDASPDGRTLVTVATDGTVQLWDVDDPAQPLSTIALPRTVRAVFLPDSRTVAAMADSGDIDLVDVSNPASPAVTARLVNGTVTLRSRAMAISHDGRLLATAGPDRTINLWALQPDQ